MLMYNLLEYSKNYFMTSRSLWNYDIDEVNDDANENDYRIGSIPGGNNRFNTEVVIPLKYLSNFWKSLDLHLIICEYSFTCHSQRIA